MLVIFVNTPAITLSLLLTNINYNNMKSVTTYFLALMTILLFACSPDKQPEEKSQQPDPNVPLLNTNQNSSADAGGVQHYVCPNNCEGSGGSIAGVCPTCGSEYQHNALFHSADNTPAQPAPDYSQMNKSPLFKDAQPNQTQSTIQTNSDAGGVAGVQHYVCPNGCAGSGGENAGTCPTCGTEYQHNSAYHATNQSTTVDPSQAQPAASSQNAAGEYHYICSNGCSGGAAASGNCSQCGAALAHNTAFHQ